MPPPVDSRLQELPLSKLTWQNFEKLCFGLARSEADVECCRIHGEVGHDQDGIDLFARKAGREKWTVYQCKRVQDFGPAAIEAAVRDFLDGGLVARTERFVLCSSESLRALKRWEAVEKMRDELQRQGMELEVWDSLELNARLKEKPELVADFFHEDWARSFCGFVPDNLAQRLTADDVRNFRRSCRGFYEQCFGQADVGWLAGGSGGHAPLPLVQRFVARHIVEKRTAIRSITDASPGLAPVEIDPETTRPGFQKHERISRRPAVYSLPEVRIAFSDWIAQGGQFLYSLVSRG